MIENNTDNNGGILKIGDYIQEIGHVLSLTHSIQEFDEIIDELNKNHQLMVDMKDRKYTEENWGKYGDKYKGGMPVDSALIEIPDSLKIEKRRVY